MKTSLNPTYLKALWLYQQKKWQAAANELQKVRQQDPNNAKALFKLGMCHYRLKQWIRAADRMTEALALAPQNQHWSVQQQKAVKESVKSKLTTLKANTKLSATQKEDQVRDLLALDYNNAELHNELAHALRKQGKWWQEVEALTQATSLKPQFPTWHYRLGEALEAMNRFQQAAAAYGTAIELKKGKAEALWHYRQGFCYEREGHDGVPNPAAAQKAYQQATAKDATLNAKRYGIGVFHQSRGYWPQALAAYSQQWQQQPWDAELSYRVGMAHDRCYEWSQAEDWYKKALSIQLDKPQWHYRLGFVLERQEKYLEAAQAYEYVATHAEKHTPYWFYRWGYVLDKAGRHEEAVQAFLRTKEHPTLDAPLDAPLHAPIYLQQVNSHQFIADTLEEVLRHDTTNPEHWYQLGNAYERLENWEKAADAYGHAVKRSNEHKQGWYYRLGYVAMRASRLQDACVYFKNSQKFQLPHGVEAKVYAKTPSQMRISIYAEFLQTRSIDDNSILYESWVGERFSCNPYAIFKHISENHTQKYTHIIVANNKNLQMNDVKHRTDVIFVSRDSDLYLYYLATAKYLINNTSFPNFFIRRDEQKYLNTWHGTPQKCLGIHEVNGLFNRGNPARNFIQATHIISPNEHTTNSLLDGYDARFAITAKLAETGYPRCDLMMNITDEKKQRLKDRLKVNNDKKTVLYAPTWRGERLNPKTGGRELDVVKLLAKFNCNVLFRGHFLAETQLRDLQQSVVFVDADIDTNELLAITDLLVTDYSSIYFDFIATKRPIIHYVYDYDDYCLTRGVYFGAEEMPGYVCYTEQDLNNSLDHLDKYLTEDAQIKVSQQYQNAIEKFALNEDGFASQRATDFFIDDKGSFVDFSVKNKSTTLMFGGHLKPNGITNSFISAADAGIKSGKKICLVIDRQAVSGQFENAKQFSKINPNITVLGWTPSLVATIEERYVLNQVKIHKHCTSFNEKEYRRLMKVEYRRNFGNAIWSSVIDFNGYSPFWTDVLSESEAKKKSIFCHSDVVEEYKIRFPDFYRIMVNYKKFDQIISVSKDLKNVNEINITKLFPEVKSEGNKFIYLENLLDEARIFEKPSDKIIDLLSRIKLNKQTKFCSIGRLSPEKGYKRLIEAFKDLLDSGFVASLYIVGSGPDFVFLDNYIKANKLEQYVFLLGYIDNPFPVLTLMDCFVMSSFYEGQGLAILEALAIGIPVIATDSIGPRSILQDGYGCIVENSKAGIREGLENHLSGVMKYKKFDIFEYNKTAKVNCLDVLF